MTKILSTIEAKELLRLCKTGRLFEIQSWISSGNSICVSADSKTTPLEVALETGFHSLVEMLVRNETSQEVKNEALQQAVSLKRLDLIELLVSHGAEVSSVPFIEVLRIWEPTITRYFLNHGTDFIAGSPFAVAFGEKIRTALRPWRKCREKYPNLAPQLQEQADRALRHFCFKGDLKWVRLLMWAGADPRSSGPMFDEDDPDGYATALDDAAYCKDSQILKSLKPDANRDDIDTLLSNAAGGGRAGVVEYLLELGAKPNDKLNGGSSALDNCLGGFRYEAPIKFYQTDYGARSKGSKYDVSHSRATVQLLLELGALWRPDDARQLAGARRGLYDCEPDVTLELVERLVKYTACTNDTIHELLRTPAMKKHLTPEARKFGLMGFDIRTKEQKVEDERREEEDRKWILRDLMSRYNREKICEEIWAEPILHVAKRYSMSDVGLGKVCKKLKIPKPGLGYWAKKVAGKPIPKRPPLPDLLT